VTREEFEVQRAVLARTRDKLAALEAKLQEQAAPALIDWPWRAAWVSRYCVAAHSTARQHPR
jgi:hypothetical protein